MDHVKKTIAQPVYDYPALLSYRIVVLANLLTKGAARLYSRRFGIQLSEWRLLTALAVDAPTGAMRMARSLGADKGWVSRTLALLARKGLVAYAKHPDDSRRMNIALTPAGRSLYKRVLPAALERQRVLLAGFSPAEVRTFRRLLERLHNQAEAAMAPPAAGEQGGPAGHVSPGVASGKEERRKRRSGAGRGEKSSAQRRAN